MTQIFIANRSPLVFPEIPWWSISMMNTGQAPSRTPFSNHRLTGLPSLPYLITSKGTWGKTHCFSEHLAIGSYRDLLEVELCQRPPMIIGKSLGAKSKTVHVSLGNQHCYPNRICKRNKFTGWLHSVLHVYTHSSLAMCVPSSSSYYQVQVSWQE